MKISLICALIFCSVFAESELQTPSEFKSISDQLKEALEKLKKRLPCGIPQMKVPPLAPYKRPYTEVQYEHILFSILGIFTDSRLDGLNNFNVSDINFNVFTLKSKFDINFNEMHLGGDYIMNLFLVNIMRISGKGNLDLTLKDLRLKGDLKIAANDTGLFIKNFNIDVSLGGIKSKTTGLLYGGLLGKIANLAIERFTMFFIKHEQKFINETVYENVIPKVNRYLHGKSMTDIFKMIDEANKPVNCTPPAEYSLL